MPTVAEILREHGTLEVKCVDRLYLNGSVPRLKSEGGVVGSLHRARGQTIPSPALFGQMTDFFKTRLRAYCQARGIPWIEFTKGERTDDVLQRSRERFPAASGVVLWSGWPKSARRAGRRPRLTRVAPSTSPTAGSRSV